MKKIVDLDDFARELGNFAKLSHEKKKKAVISGVAMSIPDLVSASPVDTGLYAASWDMSVQENSVTIGNSAPYAGVIEYGARPFTPPIGPLLAWAKRHLGQGGSHDTGQPETDYTPEVWALAKAVQKKIKEQGMAPKHVMENSIPLILENIKAELKNAR